METSLFDRLAAFCASVVLTATLLQSVALLGHPRHADTSQLAQGCLATQFR